MKRGKAGFRDATWRAAISLFVILGVILIAAVAASAHEPTAPPPPPPPSGQPNLTPSTPVTPSTPQTPAVSEPAEPVSTNSYRWLGYALFVVIGITLLFSIFTVTRVAIATR
jgi:hypothetical protein